MSDLVLQNVLPTGWHEGVDRYGNEVRKRFDLEVGDLIVLLKKELGDRLRFNLLTKKIELDGTQIPAEQMTVVYAYLSMAGYKISDKAAKDGFYTAAYENRYHPVKEYLNSVLADDSVVPVDLDQIATKYFHVSDSLSNEMLRVFLVGAVKRTFEPGCVHKSVLTLVGGQNCGKSASGRILASPPWFKDTMQEGKDFLQAIHGAWIYELAEMDGVVGRSKSATFKNQLSSVSDWIRIPYLQYHDTYLRQSVFWGTSNRRDFLKDETGSVRFHIIDLPHDAKKGERIDLEGLTRDRDAIWKAAYLAYRDGAASELSTRSLAESEARNGGYAQVDPLDNFIESWIDQLERDRPDIKGFTTEEALNLSGAYGLDEANKGWGYPFKVCDRRDTNTAARVLRRLGYEISNPLSHYGKRKRLWQKKDTHDTQPVQDCVSPQTSAAAADPGDLTHNTLLLSESESVQLDAITATATPEVETCVPCVSGAVGSGYDVLSDDDDDPYWGLKPQS